MATNVTAAAAHIAYDMQPPESLHRTKYQIKAKKNQDLEHTELEMLITMNVHIPLPNPNPNRVAYHFHFAHILSSSPSRQSRKQSLRQNSTEQSPEFEKIVSSFKEEEENKLRP